MASETYENIELRKSDQVSELLESRRVLDDEVKMVIHNAEEKGEKLYEQESGMFLAKLRIANVTFYVKYSSSVKNEYEVHTAYSHRAELAEG